MPRDRRVVEAALCRKGFEEDRGGRHTFFVYHTTGGRRTAVRTMTSHGAGGRTLGDPLLVQMARQCKLQRGQFLELVDCPLGRERYEEILREAGEIL